VNFERWEIIKEVLMISLVYFRKSIPSLAQGGQAQTKPCKHCEVEADTQEIKDAKFHNADYVTDSQR
jgi:hypothetical protein